MFLTQLESGGWRSYEGNESSRRERALWMKRCYVPWWQREGLLFLVTSNILVFRLRGIGKRLRTKVNVIQVTSKDVTDYDGRN